MRRIWIPLAVGAPLVAVGGCASTRSAPEPDGLSDGRLGHPLGAYLTVEGVPETRGKVGASTLLVDTVNGEHIEPPVGVWIDNVVLGDGARTVLKGYESGRYIGVPPDVARATGDQPQAAWQFQRYFIATSIESGGARWREGS